MDREVLFKAKRLDNGEWIEGLPAGAREDGSYYIVTNVYGMDERFGVGNRGEYRLFHDAYRVDPSTVCEYTGLTDKNGKKIFEGDVLKIAKKSDGMGAYFFPSLEYPVNVMVKWDMCAWMWETLGENKYYISFPDAWCHYECEVIGSIHDGEGDQHE